MKPGSGLTAPRTVARAQPAEGLPESDISPACRPAARRKVHRSFTRSLAGILFAALLVLPTTLPAGDEIPPDRDEASGYLQAEDRSPLDMFRPDGSSWLVWVGPILMGVAAVLLIVFIRVFSRNAHRDPFDPEEADRDSD